MILTGNGNDLLHSGSERRSLLPPWKSLATALGWWLEPQATPRQVPTYYLHQPAKVAPATIFADERSTLQLWLELLVHMQTAG